MNETLYFWSPAMHWEQTADGTILIGNFPFAEVAPDVFPRFYFLTQKGIALPQLLAEFKSVPASRLQAFCKDLIRNRILVTSLLTPFELHAAQKNLFRHSYSEDLLYDPALQEQFRQAQLFRLFDNVQPFHIPLDEAELPPTLAERTNIRAFDEKNLINLETFSGLFTVFKQQRGQDGNIRYAYASAGGLYPVDIFLYIKEGRIEDVPQGFYYYNRIDNALQLVNGEDALQEADHFFLNRDVFRSSAFTLFFVYHAAASMPKYGTKAYYYASLETGHMVAALTQMAEELGIGLCSIGEMVFRRIERYLRLEEGQVILHAVEAGWKPARL